MSTIRVLDGVIIDYTLDGWTEFKKWLDGTYAYLSFVYADSGLAYDITALDGKVYRLFSINKADATDFETNFKSLANAPVTKAQFDDPRLIFRFGNLTASSTSEVLVFGRTYAEPASEAQRSIKSSSANDSYPSGSGARTVRIYYLNSSYVAKYEDVNLNGTSAVNTVATDIRFIEMMKVINGSLTAGAVTLMTQTGGSGTEIMGISASSTETQACHHYVPAGKRAIVIGWGGVTDDECSFKLHTQDRMDGTNLVTRNIDVRKLFGFATPPDYKEFYKSFERISIPEKTYTRVTAVPNQNQSTVIRAYLDLYEEPLA